MDHLKKKQRTVHPKDRNNFISNIFFLYALKLFQRGFKKDLEENDLYEVLSGYSSKKLGDQLEKEWENQKKNRSKLSIIRLLLSCYGFSLLLLGFAQLFLDLSELLILPYVLGKVVSFFTPGQTNLAKEDAYFYAAILIGFSFFQRIYRQNYLLGLQELGIKVRAGFCSFIYRKALKLSPKNSGNISIGNIVTLITRDVQSFEGFVFFVNDAWISVLKTIIAAYILYLRIGVAAFAGVAIFVIMMPLQVYLGTKIASWKLTACKKTDERLQHTQETLSAIKIIKMYNWENLFDSKISNVRKNEVHKTFKIFFLKFLILVLSDLDSYISFYVMLITYVLLGNGVTAEIIYFMISAFETLIFGLAFLFPIAICQIAEVKSAIKRIGIMVKSMELQPKGNTNNVASLAKISLKNVTVKINNRNIIEDVNLTVEKGLSIITGPVGSGKSFLLKTILQDYQPEGGDFIVQGSISYASQEPWLFPSSIKQNILFGEQYEESRYQEVLKVCALVYDFKLLEDGDNTIVEDRGINLSRGQQARINLARAIYKESDVYLLDDSLAALDAQVSAYVFKKCIKKFLKEKLVILVTHNENYLKYADRVITLNNGKIKLNVIPSEFEETRLSSEIDNNKDTETLKSNRTDDDNDEDAAEESSKLLVETTTKKTVYHEDKKSGGVDLKVYHKYIKFGGGFLALFLVFSVFMAAQISVKYTEKLISNWVNLEEKIFNYTVVNLTNITDDYVLLQERTTMCYWYSVLAITTAITALGKAYGLFLFTRRSSIQLHKKMITNVVNAAMEFFDKNFIGNILNRFSRDLTTVDETIPFVIYHVLGFIPHLVGVVALIASVNLIFLIPIAIIFIILVVLRQYCLRTARSLKRLDSLTRSPVIGHVNATLEGLTTIRAFKTEKILRDEFDRHQDLHTSANYTLVSSMRAFAFIMEIVCAFFISAIVVSFFISRNYSLAGHVGLAITQSIYLTGSLQWGIREWTEIEYQMTSVERVLEYTKIKQESKKGLHLENWPKYGKISFKDVSLSYTNSTKRVLKNINFVVKPQEKIGIVGRTGAGKSSIISTLFRLYDIEGKIVVDGSDIKTLSLDFLRTNISIIPQDPVLFSGSVRHNVDPTGTNTDEEIWKAVETAKLKTLLPNLDFEIVDGGSHFSIGQKQLICIARAIARKNKIIVIDEATANMDAETDALIQQTINENFTSCTVFTIAHKLKYVLSCDKVMVMDKGRAVEYDEPAELLKNKDGMFYKMMEKDRLLSKTK